VLQPGAVGGAGGGAAGLRGERGHGPSLDRNGAPRNVSEA
jgi:hypothetical protein